MLGKIEGKRRRGWQKLRWLDGITDSVDMSLSKSWETVKVREAMGLHRAGQNLVTEQQFIRERSVVSFLMYFFSDFSVCFTKTNWEAVLLFLNFRTDYIIFPFSYQMHIY